MTPLVETLDALGLTGEIELAGRWVRLVGERCSVYIVEAPWGAGYYTWCEDERERAVELYRDPATAIRVGLARAARRAEKDEAHD